MRLSHSFNCSPQLWKVPMNTGSTTNSGPAPSPGDPTSFGRGPWLIKFNQPCETTGKNTTPAVVSIAGGGGVSGTYITDPTNGDQILCIPNYTYDIPPGTTITGTSPTGDPEDPPVTGTTTTDPGEWPQIILKPKPAAIEIVD